MPRRSSSYGAPRDWVLEGEWPTATFREDTPGMVGHAVAIAVALSVALEGRSKSEVAKEADIERSTLYDILAGKTWPDTVTLAKLEAHLDTRLWPSEPSPDLARKQS